MKRSSWPAFILIAVIAAASFYGFLRLFELRFQAGDVYPPYSSLRTDPLGAKVFHDALQEAPGFAVSRNYAPLAKMGDGNGAVIFFAGASRSYWRLSDVDELEALARKGARIIVTFLPADAVSKEDIKKPHFKTSKPKTTPKPKKNAPSPKDEEEPMSIELGKIGDRWGFDLAYRAVQSGTETSLTAHSMLTQTEPDLSWHSALYFPKPVPAWQVDYRCEGAPVIIERPFGHGSIVMAADSYFLSNEAMRSERAPRLLAWILGSQSRVIFDETHLGVRENPGIATLVRKYNLGGFIAAIAVLACLFIWQSSSPLLPPRPDYDDSEIVTGKDSTSGFVSLLRRGIAPSHLMEVCLEQWKKSFSHGHGKVSGMIDRIDSIAVQGSKEPVATYRAISQLLAEKK